MKQRLLISLLFGTISYILVVISGVIMELSLEMILFKSISGLLIITTGSFTFIWIMEYLSIDEEQFEPELVPDKQKDSKGDEGLESEENFSPLNIPIVEAIESNDEGE